MFGSSLQNQACSGAGFFIGAMFQVETLHPVVVFLSVRGEQVDSCSYESQTGISVLLKQVVHFFRVSFLKREPQNQIPPEHEATGINGEPEGQPGWD